MELTFCGEELTRIDVYLSEKLDISRAKAQKMIDNHLVLVNSKEVKNNFKLKLNDVISYELLEEESLDLTPVDLNIEVVYENKNLAVIYKPKGMTVHPGAGTENDTLVHGLLYKIKDLSTINGVYRPGIVHRIDKDTTGLLVVSKNDKAHIALSNEIGEHKVRRVYYALVEGVILENDGIINAPIGRDNNNRMKMAISEFGKEAITTFHVLERFKDKTFVECVLKTGRTHQIRVHFKYIGHPVYGDPLYAKKSKGTINGQYLHAGILGFHEPETGEYLEFSYPLPEYFESELNELRRLKK